MLDTRTPDQIAADKLNRKIAAALYGPGTPHPFLSGLPAVEDHPVREVSQPGYTYVAEAGGPQLDPDMDMRAVCGETSLTMRQRTQLALILGNEYALRDAGFSVDTVASLTDVEMFFAVELSKPDGPKYGVWVDGVLKFQSRDREAIDDYAARQMQPRTRVVGKEAFVTTRNVWVAKVGTVNA